MKDILIVYSKMVVGGSTTSLLSLLNGIDYSKYRVDLLLYDNGGDLQSFINPNVNVLPQAKETTRPLVKLCNPSFWVHLQKARRLSRRYKNKLINAQIMSKYEALACGRPRKEYDVGISFLEFWPTEYLCRRVRAKRKIGWIHIDIKEAGLKKELSQSVFSLLDQVVLVSDPCLQNFVSLYPEFLPESGLYRKYLKSEDHSGHGGPSVGGAALLGTKSVQLGHRLPGSLRVQRA